MVKRVADRWRRVVESSIRCRGKWSRAVCVVGGGCTPRLRSMRMMRYIVASAAAAVCGMCGGIAVLVYSSKQAHKGSARLLVRVAHLYRTIRLFDVLGC